MSISLYDSAKKIEKDGTIYSMVKSGSKNCQIYGGQRIIDNNLRSKWTVNDTRESDWSVIAKTTTNAPLANTMWNCPTSSIYGRILFTTGLNIALYLDKKEPTRYEDLDDDQQRNFNYLLDYAEGIDEQYMDSLINLDSPLPEHKRLKNDVSYCGKEFSIKDHGKTATKDTHNPLYGYVYWNLDNL